MTLLLLLTACDPAVDTDKTDTGADSGADSGADNGADSGDSGDTAADSGGDSGGDSGDSGGDSGDSGDSGGDSGDSGGDSGDSGTRNEWELVAATTDYSTGALSTFTASGTLHDALLPISSDAVVLADGDTVYVLNRSSEDTVQVFEGGDYSAPALEFALPGGSNPQSVAECGGKLFVALYGEDYLSVHDPSTGLVVGAVDLSAFADGDGSPEAADVYAAPNGGLYVVMNQLDFLSTYESADGSGTVARVDCSSLAVVDSWDVGPNPALSMYPDHPEWMLLTGGNYFNDDYSGPELDGGVWLFDTSTDTVTGPLLTEKEVGANIDGIVGVSGGKAVTTFNDAYSWTVVCLDLTDWSWSVIAAQDVFVAGRTASIDGRVWLSQRPGFAGTDGPQTLGIVPYDPRTCAAGPPVSTALPPSSVAVRTW